MNTAIEMFAGDAVHGSPRSGCYCEPCKMARGEHERHIVEGEKDNLVYVGVRPRKMGVVSSAVGYFGSSAELPEGWQLTGERDISDVMLSLGTTDKTTTLEIMNKHWRQ